MEPMFETRVQDTHTVSCSLAHVVSAYLVVLAMHEKVELKPEPRGVARLHVEDETVKTVLNECPQQTTKRHQ